MAVRFGFFFSSRRRHTRFDCDWSSDVCSSDLKRYGATRALAGVSLDVAPGEFFTLLGPSGCGKTTSLRAVAGFVAPDAGDVLIRGARLNPVPPHPRHRRLLFQAYALFPHPTLRHDVAL